MPSRPQVCGDAAEGGEEPLRMLTSSPPPRAVSDVRAQLVCARQSALADVDYGVDEFLWGLLRHIVTDASQDSV
jgi:hypothetical protein